MEYHGYYDLDYDLDEAKTMKCDISRAEALLHDPNARTRQGSRCLLSHYLSPEDSGWLRHLEVSRWRGDARACVWRLFINHQTQLCLTMDGIQYNSCQCYDASSRSSLTISHNRQVIGTNVTVRAGHSGLDHGLGT